MRTVCVCQLLSSNKGTAPPLGHQPGRSAHGRLIQPRWLSRRVNKLSSGTWFGFASASDSDLGDETRQLAAGCRRLHASRLILHLLSIELYIQACYRNHPGHRSSRRSHPQQIDTTQPPPTPVSSRPPRAPQLLKMEKKGGPAGGLNFTKAVPNFMAMMAGGSDSAAADVGGIEGAVRRHEAKQQSRDAYGDGDREEGEDEAPVVVDEAEALTAKERRKLEAKPASHRTGGSLRFKDESSAAAKFTDSAHSRVLADEERCAQDGEMARAAEAADEAAAAAAGKAHLFKAGAQQPKLMGSGKRKVGAAKTPKAKAVKNAKLLSFAEDEEEDS